MTALFEALESRTLLDAVSVTYTAHSITIKGDADGNKIVVQPSSGVYEVVPDSGSVTTVTVKGTAPAVGNKVDIVADLGKGDNSIIVTAQARNVTLKGGSGADLLEMASVMGGFGSVSLQGGDGNNTLELEPNDYAGAVSLTGGKGDDSIFLVAGVMFEKSVTVKAGDGNNYMVVGTGIYKGSVSIVTGAGADSLWISPATGTDADFRGAFNLNTGAGNDTIGLGADSGNGGLTRFLGKTTINTGAGNDIFAAATGLAGTQVQFKGTSTVDLGAGANKFDVNSNNHASDLLVLDGRTMINLGSTLGQVGTDGVLAGSIVVAGGYATINAKAANNTLKSELGSAFSINALAKEFHLLLA